MVAHTGSTFFAHEALALACLFCFSLSLAASAHLIQPAYPLQPSAAFILRCLGSSPGETQLAHTWSKSPIHAVAATMCLDYVSLPPKPRATSRADDDLTPPQSCTIILEYGRLEVYVRANLRCEPRSRCNVVVVQTLRNIRKPGPHVM